MRKYLLVCLISLVILTLSFVAVSQEKEISILLTGSPLADVMETLQDDFEKETGIKVNVEIVGYEDTHTKGILDLVSGTNNYDLLMVDNPWIAEYVQTGNLLVLDEFMAKEDPEYLAGFDKAVLDAYGLYEGKYYGYPIMLTTTILFYRSDLFEQYGKKAPETWDEYLVVAEFFNRKAGESLGDQVLERDFYGTAYYGQKDNLFAWWGNIFAGYGGVYFDEETLEPGINSEAALKALEMNIKIHQFCPPDVLAYGYEELKDIYLNGDCFMIVQWPCVGKKGADPAQSKIVGKVGVSHVPGVETDGEIYFRALMPCGRVLAIANDSRNQETAFKVIHYLSTVTSMDDVSTAETGLDPYRYSHFEHPEEYDMFENVEDARIYLEGVQKNMEKGYPEMVLPGTVEYEETLGVELIKALSGEKDAKQALDDAAQQWKEITDRLGYEKQKEMFQALVRGWKEAGLW